MVISLKRLAEWAKFLTAFVVLTLILYQVIAFFTHWIQPSHRYGEPKGRAVKVFAHYGQPGERIEEVSLTERLRLFYWLGE
ncbi:Protein of unknown function [Marininema mesophilum]|uniref:DUF4227 domain-containing protein n=1 Tax=Marininema mesophilum TaxID=1048340 RepID=A0A1H2UIV0_9BACL|nr:DUF4227 family protein [Marininema mesophilum]SDW55509.1 Protein of unknown function [Marininema mesophilum]